METFRTSAFILLLAGIFLFVTFACGLHMMCWRGVRRYQRVLNDTYSERFERRAIVARSLHNNLGQAIQRSKSVVDQVRETLPDGQKTEAAFNQISEWLEGAAGESDRALRSLESAPVITLNHGYIAKGEYVDTKTNSHHDC